MTIHDDTTGHDAPFSGGGGVQSIVEGANVTVDATDPANPVVSATGGGGGPEFLLSGDGSPEGAEAADVGTLYQDTINGALYEKVSGAGNTGWVAVGGNGDQAATPGVTVQNGTVFLLGSGDYGGVFFSTVQAYAGTGNGIGFQGSGDGDEDLAFNVKVGASGSSHYLYFPPDGVLHVGGEVQIDTLGKGFVVKSPDGTLHRILVANDGTLSTEVVT